MKYEKELEQLLEENKDVLLRLKNCGDEYYTIERLTEDLHINNFINRSEKE